MLRSEDCREASDKILMVFIQMYFTPEDFFNVFIRLLSQVFILDAPGISEKDENRSKSTKVTKVRPRTGTARPRTEAQLSD